MRASAVLLSFVVFASLSTRASAAEDDGNSAENSAETSGEKPISPEALAAIMKHPTEPDFDPLRPMSGRWVRCSKLASNETANLKSEQDRFSSSDRSHFSRTTARASDDDCKTVINEERTSYECVSADKKTLDCKVTKRETKSGSSPWALLKLSGHEAAVKISFLGVERSKKKKKKSADPKKLSLRLTPDGAEAQTLELEFEPATPKLHKTND